MAQSVRAANLSLEDKKVLAAIQGDVTSLYTAIAALVAKLDADAGVTDTNYTALCAPAAQQSAA